MTTMKGITCLAKVVNIHDGDTLRLVIHGPNGLLKFNCRMMGYNSPELNCSSDTAWKATNELAKRVCDQEVLDKVYKRKDWTTLFRNNKKLITVSFAGHDKYGRELVKIYDDNVCINDDMLSFEYNVRMVY